MQSRQGPGPTQAARPEVLILGSAAQSWPVPGCRCVTCRSGRPAAAAALRVGRLTVADGGIVASDGARRLAAGERYEADGVRVVALPGARPESPALVLRIGDRTMLWAEGPGDLPDQTVQALADAGLAAAALDLRRAEGRPDPRQLAHTIARLRAVQALAPAADLVTIGRTHDLQPVALANRLSWWGVRVAEDGSELVVDGGAPSTPHESARTLVLGPASSGKSAAAEDLLAAEPRVVYAATGPELNAEDRSWSERVAAHRNRRPPWWTTDESGDLVHLLAEPGPPLLVDALGTWLAGAMDRAGAWEDAQGWRTRIEGEVDAVVAAWRQAGRRVVAVGEEVGWGIIAAEPGVAAFRELLGGFVQRLAGESERVLLVVAGRVVALP
jgi:adenosylcobinamide kinase/adenosylcobinamide-phosphate guanylyltransferase